MFAGPIIPGVAPFHLRQLLFVTMAAASLLGGSWFAGRVPAHAQALAAQPTTGERRIALEGAPNFRDLGGYPTADGRHVRWKKIYRAGELSRLTTADYETLNRLGIAAVCDFRRDGERAAAQTRWQGANPPAILDLPGGQGERNAAGGTGGGAAAPTAGLSALLMASYPEYPTTLAASYRTTIQQLMTRDGAVLYHCTAGKDRTGTFSALLLTMLGVSRDVVMQDYLLSNQYVASPERIDALVARGTARDAAVAILGVDAAYLDLMFKSIDERYGSFDAYRRTVLGVSDADLATLKAKLLE